jgi:hypothetical protein
MSNLKAQSYGLLGYKRYSHIFPSCRVTFQEFYDGFLNTPEHRHELQQYLADTQPPSLSLPLDAEELLRKIKPTRELDLEDAKNVDDNDCLTLRAVSAVLEDIEEVEPPEEVDFWRRVALWVTGWGSDLSAWEDDANDDESEFSDYMER